MPRKTFSRRDFFRSGAIGGTSLLLLTGNQQANKSKIDVSQLSLNRQALKLPSRHALDLAPARWVWYPSQRTLSNTFVLFRKEISIKKNIASAKGWILGDSRYLLSVNGNRVQWGPPPADPRFSEADPVDLLPFLNEGKNALGANVLYYGYGDGTWPIGKPGFIFKIDIKYSDGSGEDVVTDGSWQCKVARSWKPGQYKRWYLRSLQEEFDARYFPYGWDTVNFDSVLDWEKVQVLGGEAGKTALSSSSSDYMYNSSSGSTVTELRKRTIPMIKEIKREDIALREVLELKWNKSVQEYFEMVVPESYEVINEISMQNPGPWKFPVVGERKGLLMTFEVSEQMIGWPFFRIYAPEGTVVELLVHEAHKLYTDGGPALMNSHFNSWTRFICQEGENVFETFDFESIKWIQLHIHSASDSRIQIGSVGIRRRMYEWPNPPKIKTSARDLQKIVDACINTIYNNSLDTIVDGMGRERQQYSGDIGHVLHALYRVFGEEQLPARYLNTYSQGLTKDGFFLDCWPAYDRLNRLAQRQLDLTPWGPLLDHGVGFNFDCFHHYLYTGRLEDLEEIWPRLVRFYHYLKSIVREDGMLPVEDIGVPAVWIDHDAYKLQRHKQCAFNLYSVAMLKNAFIPLARKHQENELVNDAETFSSQLLTKLRTAYWDRSRQLYVCNKPWLAEEGEVRLCDRSLATAILFDLLPVEAGSQAMDVLVKKPTELGLSYPPNSNWYLWALGKYGRSEEIIEDFRSRWIKLRSIHKNNTMQEAWRALPDSSSQWSHAAIAPLFILYSELAGIQPTRSAYAEFKIEPRPGNLALLELSNHTPAGPIEFKIEGKLGKRALFLNIPNGIQGELVLDKKEQIKLPELKDSSSKKHYLLKGGDKINLKLKYT